MNGKFLLDTNVILGFLKGAPSVVNFVNTLEPGCLHASVITRMELLSFHGITADEEKAIRDVLAAISIIPLSAEVEDIATRLRRATRRKMPDAIVAVSAVSLGAVLVTSDRELAATEFPGLRATVPGECV
jgi:Predicted nucleic acid-binding protein, contains PIN domain